MSNKPRCSHLTTRGRPCRNPAAPGTEPPACATHKRVTSDELRVTSEEGAAGAQPYLPGLEPPGRSPTDPQTADPQTHFYFPRPTSAEQRVLAATAEAPDLRPEVELVRVVLRQLLVYLNESAGELPPEEVRRVAGLLFTGARTVALLLGKRPLPAAETEAWMADALRLMGDQYGRDL